MRNSLVLSASVVAALTVLGCGGGGGGGDDAVTQQKTAEPLALTVKINGATGGVADSYSVKPGDTVEVTASAASTWTNNGAQVQLLSSNTTATQWTARLVNAQPVATAMTLNASAGSGAVQNKSITFNVAAGDARNGSYKVYSASGSRATLDLNFDVASYAMRASNVGDVDLAGTFSEDASQAATYLFASERIASAVNTARFRVNGDTVVGAFSFPRIQTSPVTYPVSPFIASRALETDPSKLDGIYNRLGINQSASGDDSQITQVQILNSGTLMKQCSNSIIYPISTCPPASITTYTIQAGTTPDTWQIVSGSGAVAGSFAIARQNGERIYLGAGKLNSTSTDTIARIGLPESPLWPSNQGWGSATTGSWGSVDVQAANFTRFAITPDGSAEDAAGTFAPLAVGPQGIRSTTVLGLNYFAVQGAGVSVVVGARNGGGNGHPGYMQINLMN
jgi:hypothetical protein